ncbi:MAG: AAA family ATPase, partial [Acidimicrobiales bacterium]
MTVDSDDVASLALVRADEYRSERQARAADNDLGLVDSDDGRSLTLLPASAVSPQRTRWFWEGRVPLGGATLLAGQEGSGKTTIAVELAARATRGQLAGNLQRQTVGIVYATAEDSWSRTLRPRFEAAGADLDRVHFVVIDGLEGGLEIPGDLSRLAACMRDVDGRLLVLDPLGAHLHG